MTGREMSSRERVLATLNHRIPDRVPVYEVGIEEPYIRLVLNQNVSSSWLLSSPYDLVKLYKALDLDAVMLPMVFWKPREMMGTHMEPEELTPPSRERVIDSVGALPGGGAYRP